MLHNQDLSGVKSELQGETMSVSSYYKGIGQLPYNSPHTKHANVLTCVYYPIKNYRCCTGGPLSIMENNYSCIFPICCA